MGWEVVSADEFDGRIEAVAETRLFGFKDNVAVRISAEGDHSRVDVRVPIRESDASTVGRTQNGSAPTSPHWKNKWLESSSAVGWCRRGPAEWRSVPDTVAECAFGDSDPALRIATMFFRI